MAQRSLGHSPLRAAARWGVAATLLVLIAVVSQGVHDIAIEHLGVPYPAIVNRPPWLMTLGDIVRVVFIVVFCRLSRDFLRHYSIVMASLIVGALVMCLSEGLRVPLIDFCLVDGWVGTRWVYALTSLIPRLAVAFAQGGLAIVIARCIWPRSVALSAILSGVAGIAVRLAVAPIAEGLTAALNALAQVSQPKYLHEPPYGLGMLFVIYLTFLEPTISAVIMARLSWTGLPGRKSTRIAWFTLLVLGASGRLTLFFVNSFWVRQPLGLAFLSTGQFVAEMALMAALAGWFSSRSGMTNWPPSGASAGEGDVRASARGAAR